MEVVGQSVPRKDGAAKVAGAARYVDDITMPGMLYGRTIRTTIPAGRLTGVRLDFDQGGFTVADWRDIPGKNAIEHLTDEEIEVLRDKCEARAKRSHAGGHRVGARPPIA